MNLYYGTVYHNDIEIPMYIGHLMTHGGKYMSVSEFANNFDDINKYMYKYHCNTYYDRRGNVEYEGL